VGLISLLDARDEILQGQVSLELMGKSGGERYGRDKGGVVRLGTRPGQTADRGREVQRRL